MSHRFAVLDKLVELVIKLGVNFVRALNFFDYIFGKMFSQIFFVRIVESKASFKESVGRSN